MLIAHPNRTGRLAMTRRAITFLTSLLAVTALGIGATGAVAKQGADDPVGHVRHAGTDDGTKAKKCHKAKHGANASAARKTKCNRAKKSKRNRTRGAHHPVTHDAGDDNGANRPAGTTDDPATHDAGDDNGANRPAGTTDDPAGHDAGDDNGGHGSDD
jgi:hypothetical protein